MPAHQNYINPQKPFAGSAAMTIVSAYYFKADKDAIKIIADQNRIELPNFIKKVIADKTKK